MNKSKPINCEDCLSLTLKHLEEEWGRPGVGIVAAGWFHSDEEPLIRTSSMVSPGVWNHAERNVVEGLLDRYGVVPQAGSFVVTLSPCMKSSGSRNGISCTDLLLAHGVSRVHVGALDLKQAPNGLSDYDERGLKVSLTEREHYAEACMDLCALFGDPSLISFVTSSESSSLSLPVPVSVSGTPLSINY